MTLRILMLHGEYGTRGGEDESTRAEAEVLRANGHLVDLIVAPPAQPSGFTGKVSVGAAAVWSSASYEKVSHTIRGGDYDLLHVQNFFPEWSPSVYYAANSLGVPVVQAVRNYRLICPSANLFRDGSFCSDCVGRWFPTPGVRHACYRESRLATFAVGSMQAIHRLAGTWSNRVNAYIALTDYVRARLIEGGLPGEKIYVKPNFVFPRSSVELENDGDTEFYVLFVGRLTAEKGILWLIDQWRLLGENIPLKVIGEGELSAEAYARTNDIPVEFLGRRPLDEVYSMMARAGVVVVPGSWPEPFGRVIIEAFAAGTPVIAANAGGMPELVREGVNGFLFQPGDSTSFLDAVCRIHKDNSLRREMRKSARSEYMSKYTPSANYDRLMEIYSSVVM